MIKMKSTAKRIKDLDFSGEVTITKLTATRELINFHHDRMKKSFPNMSEQEIWQKINNIVVRDNVFNEAMKKVVPCYEFNVDDGDIKALVENIKKGNPNFANAKPEVLNMMARRTIEKELVFQDIQKLYKIEVTDQEVKDVLHKMYETTNYPIRDFINNQEKINNLKAPILDQKTADTLISKIKWKLDKEAIMRNATPPAAKPDNIKEENSQVEKTKDSQNSNTKK